MNKPTAVSFFCGAGGMDLGFIGAGFDILAAWDWDSHAVKSYYENIGEHVNVMDIKEMTYDDIPKADVWLFGFPCQDISVAGSQKGLIEGERSSMFFHVMRLLNETRELEPNNLPKIIMAENVKRLRLYLPILEEEYAKQGYKMCSELFNSKYWGVPQSRDRYFVVGVRDDLPQTFEFPEEQKEYVPKLSSILETEVDEKYYISDDKAQKIIEQALHRLDKLGTVHATITPDRVEKRQNGRRAKEEEAEMFTLTAQDVHGVIEASPECVGMLDIKAHDHSRRVYASEGNVVSPTLTAVQGGTHHIKILTGTYGQKNGFVPSDQSNTLDASAYKGLGCNQARPAVAEIYPRYRVRKLTPREYMRLQGFSDDYKQVVSDSQMYKQMGNAVTVPKAKGTAEEIKRYLENLTDF